MATEQKEVTIKKNQTGMKDNKKDILGELMGKPYPSLHKKEKDVPQLAKDKDKYSAFEEFKGRKSPRFRIVDLDGKSYGCSYAHLIEWVFHPPALLTLTTASRVFNIQGKHLDRIEQLLMEEKIKELHVFNTQKHKAPPPKKPLIESLEVMED